MAAGQEQPRSPLVLDARWSLTRQHAIASGGLPDGWFAGPERPIRQCLSSRRGRARWTAVRQLSQKWLRSDVAADCRFCQWAKPGDSFLTDHQCVLPWSWKGQSGVECFIKPQKATVLKGRSLSAQLASGVLAFTRCDSSECTYDWRR